MKHVKSISSEFHFNNKKCRKELNLQHFYTKTWDDKNAEVFGGISAFFGGTKMKF